MLEVDGLSIYLTRGDSAILQATPTIKNDQGEKQPYVFVEGDKVIFRLKLKAEDTYQVVCEKECSMDYVNNKAILHLVPDDTDGCEFKKYRYEFELITVEDFHSTFIENQEFTIGKELETHGGS